MIIKEFVFVRIRRGEGSGGVEGGLLHMNINLDSTSIIITGHKTIASFFLQRFLLSVSILGATLMHTSIFSAWGEGAVEYLNLGSTQESQIHTWTCVKDTLYIHVRECLATKDIPIGVLQCQDKGVGSRMPLIGPVDWHKQILITLAVLIFSACRTSLLSDLACICCLVYNIGCWI